MKWSDLVKRESVVPDLKGQDRDSVIHELVEALVAGGKVPATMQDAVVQAVLARESRGSTGFGKGVAVPHGKHADLPELAAAVGVSQLGVEFKAFDREPVFAVVLLVSPTDQREAHLQAMESIFSDLQDDQFRRFLQQAKTQDEVLDVLFESKASGTQS